MKLLLTYKNNITITPWFNYKHIYLLSGIGLLQYKFKADFDKWVTDEPLKRIRKPTCN